MERKPPEDGQAQIRYAKDGVVTEWGVGCDAANDDGTSMANHLKRWIPDAEFMGVCITRVKDGVVVSDTRTGKVSTAIERHAMAPISQLWIKGYVDEMMRIAMQFDDGPMRTAAAMRAKFAMDLVQAWRERRP